MHRHLNPIHSAAADNRQDSRSNVAGRVSSHPNRAVPNQPLAVAAPPIRGTNRSGGRIGTNDCSVAGPANLRPQTTVPQVKRETRPQASTILAQFKGSQPASSNKKPPVSSSNQPNPGSATAQLRPKTLTPTRSIKQPIAPAAYRPQPTPHVLQLKRHGAQSQKPVTSNSQAPPPFANLQNHQQQTFAARQAHHTSQSNQASEVQRKKVVAGQPTVQRKALVSSTRPSPHSIHSRKVIQRAEIKSTFKQPELPKEERRMKKANMLMENQSTGMNPQEDVALHIKNKVCSSETVKLKVLIISDATPQHLATYTNSNLKTLSGGFDSKDYQVTPTYFHAKDVYDSGEKLDSPWHAMDINEPKTYPSEQFELILARNVICFCHDEETSCGGISVNNATEPLKTVASKLSLKKGARAILTIPLGENEFDNSMTWSGAVFQFNRDSTDYQALTITDKAKGFYGIKIKPRKK